MIVCARGVQSFEDCCSIRCYVVEAGGERSAQNEFGGKFAGTWLLVDPACWSCAVERRRSTCGTSFWRVPMSATMEQVVSQLQQEFFNLRAQVAAQSGLAEAVRAINNLATAQVRRDTPSLIDVNGLGRPKEFSGKEEDSHTVVEEDRGILRWSDQGVRHDVGVDRYTSHVIFLMQFAHLITCISHCMAQDEPPHVSVCARHFHLHAIHDVCVSVRCLSLCVCPSPVSLSFTSSLPHSTCTLPGTPSPMSITPTDEAAALTHNEEYCPMAIWHPLTGYEPNVFDDFHYSETSAMIFQDKSGDIDTEPSYSCDAELDDETIGKAQSSPLFVQEREEPADWRQAYHSHEESLLSSQSFFAHTRTGRPVHELSSCQKRKSSRDMESERIRILLERQKEQILAEVRTEIQKHELQADSDRRSIQELNGITESQRRENWSYSCRVWPIQARSTTSSRTTIRTKSGSSWSSYQKSLWDGRIEQSSGITSQGIFEKKIGWKSRHYKLTHGQEWSSLYGWFESF